MFRRKKDAEELSCGFEVYEVAVYNVIGKESAKVKAE